MVWLEFFGCASLLTFFAYNLCAEGVKLSEATHMEEGIIGMFFLAVATSFPEIVTSATAVSSLDRIGLGYGDIAGSVMVNLMILFGLDLFYGDGRILAGTSRPNRVTSGFAFLAASLVLLSAAARMRGIDLPSVGPMGVESLLLVAIYSVFLGKVRADAPQAPSGKETTSVSFMKTWATFIALLVVVMFLSVWMARIGEDLVVTTGVSQTFIGTLFLGVATSLPEIIVSFAALKAASIDMAIGNILGSNLFDICIVSLLDILTKGPILGMLTAGQVLATFFMALMSLLVVVGIFVRQKKGSRHKWDTGLIFAVGLIGFVLIYFIR